MNASDRVLARRYAQALYLAAAEGGGQDKAHADLASAYMALASRLDFLKNPTVSSRDHKALVERIVPGRSPLIRHFLDLLIDKKRIALLPSIVADLQRVADERAGRVRAQIRSAAELSPEELDGLVRRLKKFSGKDVVAQARPAPELLGGAVVRMGDLVLDGSIQGGLKRLAARLVED